MLFRGRAQRLSNHVIEGDEDKAACVVLAEVPRWQSTHLTAYSACQQDMN